MSQEALPVPQAEPAGHAVVAEMEAELEATRPAAIGALLAGTALLRVGAAGAGVAVQFDLRDLGAAAVAIGLVGAAQASAEMVFSPFLARLADRMGRNLLLVAGPLLSSLAAMTCAAATHPVGIAAARFAEGVGAAAFVPTALGTIAAATSHSRSVRATASGAFEGANLAGYAGGFIVGPLAYHALGRSSFLVLAALYFIAAMVCLRFVPRVPPLPVSPLRVIIRAVTGPGPIRSFIPAWVCSFALLGAYASNLAALLRRNPPGHRDEILALDPNQFLVHRFEDTWVGVVLVLWIILLVVGIAAWTPWLPRVGAAQVMRRAVPGAWLLAVALIAVNHSSDRIALGLLPVVVIGILWLAGFGPAAVTYLAECSETYTADRSALMAFYTVTLAAGGAVGAVLGGLAVQIASADGLFVFSLLLAVASFLALGPVVRYERALLRATESPAATAEPSTL